jgi:hypothetical protein
MRWIPSKSDQGQLIYPTRRPQCRRRLSRSRQPRATRGGIEQFWREQLLVTAMLQHALYDEGRLLVITPALNHDCRTALRRYPGFRNWRPRMVQVTD